MNCFVDTRAPARQRNLFVARASQDGDLRSVFKICCKNGVNLRQFQAIVASILFIIFIQSQILSK